MDTGLVGEAFLAQTLGPAVLLQVGGEALSNVIHPHGDTAMSMMGLQTIRDIPLDLSRQEAMTDVT